MFTVLKTSEKVEKKMISENSNKRYCPLCFEEISKFYNVLEVISMDEYLKDKFQ